MSSAIRGLENIILGLIVQRVLVADRHGQYIKRDKDEMKVRFHRGEQAEKT